MADRGVYRAIFSALFDDLDYQTLSSKARLVLLTARQCAQAGPAAIFRYYPEVLARQTGLSVKGVAQAIEELADAGWVIHEAPILWVRNGLRYDPTMRLADVKHQKSVLRALDGLPQMKIVLTFCDYYHLPRPFEGPSETLRGFGASDPPRPIPSPKKTEVLPDSESDGFARFWSAYPIHEDKQQAAAAWKALAPDPDLCALILGALEAQKQVMDQGKAAGQFIPEFPHPHRWLKHRRWTDEPRRLNTGASLSPTTAANVRAVQQAIERHRGGP